MKTRKVRVLQVVGSMNIAGLETWLMHVLRGIDRDRFTIDFLVGTNVPGAYDDEVRSLGSRLSYSGQRKPLRYSRAFRRFLLESEPYDVVHSHLNHLDGDIMRLAHHSGIPVRIAHSHTDTTAKEASANLPRRLMVQLMHYWIAKYCTVGLAASEAAAVSMFGNGWQQRAKCRILVSGFDVSPFAGEYDPSNIRTELRIPAAAWVIGHVGRFEDVKNHSHILKTFSSLHGEVPDAWLLLVGDGPLRAEMQSLSKRLGIDDRTIFTGNRRDIPAILCTAVDTFVFPSKFEGLGMALVEAQAAGLPCVVSDVVPREADVIPELITRLSIQHSWTAAVLATRSHATNRANHFRRVVSSEFAIQHAIAVLEELYATVPAEDDLDQNVRKISESC